MMNRKNRVLLLHIAFLFAVLCTGFHLFKSEKNSFSINNKQGKFLQKANTQTEVDIYNLSDIQDEFALEDLDNTLLDVEVFLERWVANTFRIQNSSSQPVIAHNYSFITLPRYILYHSLQIPGC
ncbi:hypothetical protein [Chryseobacterium sp. G0201]|uniref:hypothetical protein n=1 Tax=Chryseobacterium sp. G0201 TaxID=2487065 RepID=UPI000F4E4970|nr:hypothetical protein [Chryseobacterium sp. G0201]